MMVRMMNEDEVSIKKLLLSYSYIKADDPLSDNGTDTASPLSWFNLILDNK